MIHGLSVQPLLLLLLVLRPILFDKLFDLLLLGFGLLRKVLGPKAHRLNSLGNLGGALAYGNELKKVLPLLREDRAQGAWQRLFPFLLVLSLLCPHGRAQRTPGIPFKTF